MKRLKNISLEIYDKNFKAIYNISEFISLEWRESMFGGSFTVSAVNIDIDQIKTGYFVMLSDRSSMFYITKITVSRESNSIKKYVISGQNSLFILSQRILKKSLSFKNTDYSDVFFKAFEAASGYGESFLKIDVPSPDNLSSDYYIKSNAPITVQLSMGDLLQQMIELLPSGMGLQALFVPGEPIINDRLIVRPLLQTNSDMVFNEADISAWSYTEDKTDFKNAALIAGEGEGDVRIKVSIGSARGFDRFELYVDARDLQREDGLSLSDYQNQLRQRGISKINEACANEYAINIELNLSRYEVSPDWLGKIITIETDDFSVGAQIEELTEIFDSNGYSAFPKLRIIEYSKALITEAGDEILADDIFENKILYT